MKKEPVLPSIASLAKKHGIKPLKKFGQNFIFDENLCDKIVQVSGLGNNEIALEIGPGPAGLTRSILKAKPIKLTIIETDKNCQPLLNEVQMHYPNLDIIFADALKIKLSTIAKQKLKIIANLPYNVGTKLLLNWLKEIEYLSSLTVMLQREVAMRIVANPGSKNYGRLSVIMQLMCDCKICFHVSPAAFYPPPKVWSSIIHIEPKAKYIDKEIIYLLEKITNAAFQNRRKMLKSSLKDIIPHSAFEKLSISPELRAENLTPQQYLDLAILLTTTN